MHSHQGAHLCRPAFAAAMVALLVASMIGRAMAQSESQSRDIQSSGSKPSAAAQTALAIAGPASMTAAPPATAPVTQPSQAAPMRSAAGGREMTADQRRQFMMLLILHETSRNPMGTLR